MNKWQATVSNPNLEVFSLAIIKKYRHEYKFLISYSEYLRLKSKFVQFMNKDPYADSNSQYHVRSLYFDDLHNNGYYEKLSGVGIRKKYRIRIYNYSNSVIKLERKGKEGQYTQKESELISQDLCNDLIAGKTDSLLIYDSALLSDVYIQMKTLLLKPCVLVDYLRETYIHPIENVRITFDMNLRSGLYAYDLWNANAPSVSVMDPKFMIMEVKFNRFLSPAFSKMLKELNSERMSISKYILCRKFTEKCIWGGIKWITRL